VKKQNTKKSGIKEIARLANVSIGTVDRVLHNRGEVADSTRQQVLKIIDKFGYTPNLMAKSLASKREYTIAVLIPETTNNEYWEKPLIGINAAAEEIKHYNFNVKLATFNYSNENSFIEKAEGILESHPNGLIFAPVFYDASLQVIKKCESLSIPYVFFDVYIEGCNNLAYFGQDSIQSGYLAAKLMNYSLHKKDTCIVILKPVNKPASTYHLDLREKGFNSFFSTSSNKGKVKLYSQIIDISSKVNIKNELDDVFKKYKLNGIFVANSRVQLVAEYIKKHKIDNIVVVGYDLIGKNIEYLENGTITYLICQKPEEQGYKSVLSIFNYLMLKKPVDKLNYSPIDIIMRENVEYYKNFKI
jgi:LacI family transcriptional regulator